MLLDHYRKNLRAVVGSAAAPYGYTLSIWAAGAALVSVHGIPKTLAALVFGGEAVLEFALSEPLPTAAYRGGWTRKEATPSSLKASASYSLGSRLER
jgi:hypothetical protein